MEELLLKKMADELYLAIQAGATGEEISATLDNLLSASTSESRLVLEWREPAFGLNLMQLAIVYGRLDLVVSLARQFPAFLFEPALYQTRHLHNPEAHNWKTTMSGLTQENSPLHLAAWLGQENTLRQFLACLRFDPLTSTGVVTVRPLQKSCYSSPKRGRLGDLVEAIFPRMGSVLHLAVDGRRKHCARAILQHVIFKLLGRPCKGVFQCILKRDCRELLRAPLLHQACLAGDARTAELILARFPAEAGKRLKGALPVRTAIRHGNATLVKILLKRYAGTQSFSVQDFTALLQSLAKCRFLGEVEEIIALLVDFGKRFLQDPDSFATFALIDAVSEVSTWTLLITRTPKGRMQRYEQLLNRQMDPGTPAEEAVSGFFRAALSGRCRVDGRSELRLMGLTSMDLVLITAQRLVTDGHCDKPLLPVIRRVLECGFDPNVWSTHSDLRHMQGYLFKPRPEPRWDLPAQLLNLLCQFGWDLGVPLASTPFFRERHPAPAWLASCCTVSWCTHNLEQCYLWREDFADSWAFQVMLNYMSLGQLRDLQACLLQLLDRGHTDAATIEACEKTTAALSAVRSLQHVCKLTIVEVLRGRDEKKVISCLPWTLQNYVTSPSF